MMLKRRYSVIILGAFWAAFFYQYIFWQTDNVPRYIQLAPLYIGNLEKHNLLNKYNQIKCHVVYPKDEQTFTVRQCASSIKPTLYPITEKILGLLNIEFEAFSIPTELWGNEEFIEQLKVTLKEKQQLTKPILFLLTKQSIQYEHIQGFKFEFLK